MKKITPVLALSACVVMLSAFLLFGCTSGGAGQNNSEQQQNRAYMSQVNEIVLEANGDLDAFVDAVSSGDVVSIRSTANAAAKTLSKLSALEAPEALQDIQDDYSTGSEKLCTALNQYIDLYVNASSGEGGSAPSQEALAAIQSLYDEGVAHLKAGDEAAAAL